MKRKTSLPNIIIIIAVLVLVALAVLNALRIGSKHVPTDNYDDSREPTTSADYFDLHNEDWQIGWMTGFEDGYKFGYDDGYAAGLRDSKDPQ